MVSPRSQPLAGSCKHQPNLYWVDDVDRSTTNNCLAAGPGYRTRSQRSSTLRRACFGGCTPVSLSPAGGFVRFEPWHGSSTGPMGWGFSVCVHSKAFHSTQTTSHHQPASSLQSFSLNRNLPPQASAQEAKLFSFIVPSLKQHDRPQTPLPSRKGTTHSRNDGENSCRFVITCYIMSSVGWIAV